MLTALLAGAGLGLLSVPHCAAMCGPLAQAACASRARSAPLHYQSGRVGGYAFIGALSGHLGQTLATASIAAWLPVLLACATASALLIVAWRIHRAPQLQAAGLVTLRTTPRLGSWWQGLRSLLPAHPAAFGMASALLPCGALAAAVLVAASYGVPEQGALHMAGFAVASAPGTLLVAWLLQRLPQLRSPRLLRATALSLVVLAALMVARPVHRLVTQPTAAAAHHACH